jgi:hypothetical protein
MTFGSLIENCSPPEKNVTNQAQDSLGEVEEHLEDTPSMRGSTKLLTNLPPSTAPSEPKD